MAKIKVRSNPPIVRWGDVRAGAVYRRTFLGLRESTRFADSLLADLVLDDGTRITLPCPRRAAR
jgi:hypothetical protein